MGCYYLVCSPKTNCHQILTSFHLIRKEKLIYIHKLLKSGSFFLLRTALSCELTLFQKKNTVLYKVGQVLLRLMYLYLFANDWTVNHVY